MIDVFDLYEFPKGYVGRKTYVHIDGHKKSVPCVYTYRGTDGRNFIHPDFGGDWSGIHETTMSAPMIMRDMAAYQSPLEANCTISSRSAHRDHIKKHDVVEVGNQPIGTMKGEERAPMARAGHDIARALQGN